MGYIPAFPDLTKREPALALEEIFGRQPERPVAPVVQESPTIDLNSLPAAELAALEDILRSEGTTNRRMTGLVGDTPPRIRDQQERVQPLNVPSLAAFVDSVPEYRAAFNKPFMFAGEYERIVDEYERFVERRKLAWETHFALKKEATRAQERADDRIAQLRASAGKGPSPSDELVEGYASEMQGQVGAGKLTREEAARRIARAKAGRPAADEPKSVTTEEQLLQDLSLELAGRVKRGELTKEQAIRGLARVKRGELLEEPKAPANAALERLAGTLEQGRQGGELTDYEVVRLLNRAQQGKPAEEAPKSPENLIKPEDLRKQLFAPGPEEDLQGGLATQVRQARAAKANSVDPWFRLAMYADDLKATGSDSNLQNQVDALVKQLQPPLEEVADYYESGGFGQAKGGWWKSAADQEAMDETARRLGEFVRRYYGEEAYTQLVKRAQATQSR